MGVVSKAGTSGFSGPFWGYAAGIVTGVTYGLNPLFAIPLMKGGVSVDTILFFRYFLAVLILGGWLLLRKEDIRPDVCFCSDCCFPSVVLRFFRLIIIFRPE